MGLIIICVLITAGLMFAAFWAGRSRGENKTVVDRVARLSAGMMPVEAGKLLRKKDLDKSFNERVLFPLAQKIFDQTQAIIPLGNKSFVRAKLIQAGYTQPHYPKIFLGIQLLLSALILAFLASVITLVGKVPLMIGLLVAIVFASAGYALPLIWLMQQAGKRQDSIQKSLPDFLDLLVICVEAGLGLDMAISKIANMNGARTSEYLREELLRYNKDIAFGRPRKEAMLDMAHRTGVEDLNVIINALAQAYEMGSSVTHTLRVQADSLRVKRLQKAEEKANKIPVKMVMPIYIFLFPAIFVSIFGPIGMVMVDSMMEIFSNMQIMR
ncbi:MAG: type II secretion system F family protein [Vampirovibrionales bacterium]|nr:type II secretion system F family protein [Vampirovibrionales bacterium]